MVSNKGELQQVLINLLVNAIQAMPDGGVLTIAREDWDEAGMPVGICLSVTDTGAGIPHEMRKQSPDKEFIPAPPNDSTCACNECNFKVPEHDGEKLYNCLKYELPEIFVVAEEPASAEDRQKPFHAFGVHPAHRGDLVAAYFGDVQQTAHFDRSVRHDDLAGNRQRHQGHQRHDERGEPRREVTSFVQVVQQAAQQDEDDDVNQRPVDRAVIEAVFIRACIGSPFFVFASSRSALRRDEIPGVVSLRFSRSLRQADRLSDGLDHQRRR